MFVDAKTKVSADQQITADALSDFSIDLDDVTPNRQIGDGEPLGFAVTIKAAGTNTGSLDIQVVSDSVEALSSPTVVAIRRLATADLAAGKAFFIAVPPGTPVEQFLGLNFDVTGTVDVTVDADLRPQSMFSKPTPQSYASGSTIA